MSRSSPSSGGGRGRRRRASPLAACEQLALTIEAPPAHADPPVNRRCPAPATAQSTPRAHGRLTGCSGRRRSPTSGLKEPPRDHNPPQLAGLPLRTRTSRYVPTMVNVDKWLDLLSIPVHNDRRVIKPRSRLSLSAAGPGPLGQASPRRRAQDERRWCHMPEDYECGRSEDDSDASDEDWWPP
jgi:hypothetical protein